MHARIRKYALVVIVALQLEACLKRHLPPEDYGITETVTLKAHDPDSGGAAEVAVMRRHR